MKAKLILAVLLLITSQLFAQENPLVGTWVEESDKRGLKEIKIITPTHVGFVVIDPKVDTFAYAGYGSYTIKNGKYVENLEIASFEWDKKNPPTFTHRVEGDKFHQKGIVTHADGRKEEIEHTFTRVKLPPQETGDVIGTWHMIASTSTFADGRVTNYDSKTNKAKIVRIITPTHMFLIVQRADGSFAQVSAGTYTKKGEVAINHREYASRRIDKVKTLEEIRKVVDGKLHIDGKLVYEDSKVDTWVDIMERVEPKAAKTASNQ